MANTRLRIRFSKTDDLRWIGHMDLARLWERMLRRAELHLAMSEGFHPKPKISFPSALALGIDGLHEVVELELVGSADAQEIRQRLIAHAQPGLGILTVDVITPQEARMPLRASTFEIDLSEDQLEPTRKNIELLLAPGKWEVHRENRTLTVQVGDPDFAIELIGSTLRFTLPNSGGASFRPGELLDALGLMGIQEQGKVLRRTQVHLGRPASPAPNTPSTSVPQEENDSEEEDSEETNSHTIQGKTGT